MAPRSQPWVKGSQKEGWQIGCPALDREEKGELAHTHCQGPRLATESAAVQWEPVPAARGAGSELGPLPHPSVGCLNLGITPTPTPTATTTGVPLWLTHEVCRTPGTALSSHSLRSLDVWECLVKQDDSSFFFLFGNLSLNNFNPVLLSGYLENFSESTSRMLPH